jgi:hypothetical protein
VRFCLIHVDDQPGGPAAEAMVVVPGADRVVMEIPLDALHGFLPILHAATESLDVHRCVSCDSPIRGARAA